MKKIIPWSLLLMSILLIGSCTAKQLPPPETTYEEGAIKIHIKADFQLNLSEDRSHSLMLCVYQLKDPNAFNHLTSDQQGLYRLLECGLFDADTVGAERFIIQPGQDIVFNLSRAQGARYIAVVAGYYLIQKERIVRLYEIPVVVEKKGIIKRAQKQILDTLEIELKLGPQQIE
ncbi:MAG: type VI secretion system lipoprotein TssJ [Deltaproteobacteria bacterium]|nr:type VI secretion system lipoprotein TssJ [Deltaproteobacteria bacterium]